MMIIIIATVIIAIASSMVVYLVDDYGEYNNLKPGYFTWLRMISGDIANDFASAGEKMVFRASRGRRLFHPDRRPEGFFKEGEEVYFFNIQKVWPGYGDDMGLAIEDMPEGSLTGKVLRVNKGGDGDIVTVDINGREFQIYDYSELLMHKWEFALLKRNPFLKRFYCLNLVEADKNFKKALKVTPLH